MTDIQKSKNNDNAILYNNFSGFDLNTINASKTEFWNLLIDYMAHENNNTNLGHWLFRKKDLVDDDSKKALLEFISDQINASEDFSDVIKAIRGETPTTPEDVFWNQNVNTLIKYVLTNFDPTYDGYTGGTVIVDDQNSFDINAIKKGNAANSFEPDAETNPEHHWVESWTNAKGQTYSEVRGNDKKLTALTDDKNYDKTNENFGIKLLLPQYKRHVEVEDLDRNFWVIGQSLAGICAFLFSKNSPFLRSFEQILGEIYNLWENILYLWLAFAISMQDKKHYVDVHEEVVYLSASDFQTDLKFDNIVDADFLSGNNIAPFNIIKAEVIKKLEVLKARYSNCSLCIIPVIRLDNYEHNYYSTEYYPGAFVYDRNHPENSDNGWKVTEFNVTKDGKTHKGIISFNFYANGEVLPKNTNIGFTNNALDDLYYINADVKGMYTSPNAHTNGRLNYIGVKGSSLTCYSAFRTICSPNYEYETPKEHMYKYDSETDTVSFDNVLITIYDVAEYLRGGDSKYYSYTWYMSGNSLQLGKLSNQNYNPPASSTTSITVSTGLNQWPLKDEYNSSDFTGVSTVTMVQLDSTHGLLSRKGFYMGELLSTITGFFREHFE